MNIILDTNVLFGDWSLRSEDAKAFLQYVENTNSTIYVPRIVWEEIKKNQQEDLAKKHADYEKACRLLGGGMINQPDFLKLKFEHIITGEDYTEWLRKKLRFDVLENVLPYGADYTERIANRVMAKRKPFNLKNDHEYKDTLVWETVLDVIAGKVGKPAEEVVLISADADAFGIGKNQQSKERGVKGERQVGVLHPELQEDADAALAHQRVQRFYYYESFAEFLAAHYTPIQGISEEGVRHYLASEASGFLEEVQEVIREGLPQIMTNVEAYNAGATLIELTHPFKVKSFAIIQDFYVYSPNRGEQVTASGRAFIYMSSTATYTYDTRAQNRVVDLHPVVEVKFHIPYKNGQPEAIVFEDSNIDSGPWMRLLNQSSPFSSLRHIDGTARDSLVEMMKKILFEHPASEVPPFDLDWESLRNATFDYQRKLPNPLTPRSPVDPATRQGRKRKKRS